MIMKKLEKQGIWLLLVAPLLCAVMMLLVPIITNGIGKTTGYLISFCIYWFIFCIPTGFFIAKRYGGIREIYRQKSEMPFKTRWKFYILAFVPCAAIFFVAFVNVVPRVDYEVLGIALCCALINGSIEELFWRGIYNKVFNNHIIFAFVYPSIFFGVWHIALFWAKGIVYQGGFPSLVGGALIMGVLWGWIAYRTKSIKIVTVAHIITNFLAFTGLIYENWFL